MRLPATDPDCANETAIDLAILNAVMTRHGMSATLFAQNAGASRTVVQEALTGQRGRKVAFAWVLAQGADFVRDVQEATNRQLRLTPTAEREESFEAVVELLRRVWFRERQDEAAS
ncbi:MAG: hypothetical protein ABI634_12895 [Acidobacteriota bacterium]